ncbi:hypothetical protein WJX79_005130 [Trebouxia sp. C0005]
MLGACVKAANSVAGVAVPVEIEDRRERGSLVDASQCVQEWVTWELGGDTRTPPKVTHPGYSRMGGRC